MKNPTCKEFQEFDVTGLDIEKLRKWLVDNIGPQREGAIALISCGPAGKVEQFVEGEGWMTEERWPGGNAVIIDEPEKAQAFQEFLGLNSRRAVATIE
jgi:hypothetical protein